MLTEIEKKVVAAVQDDMPVCQRPYAEIARRIGLEESELLATLERLCRQGVIRRFGATLRHQKSGYRANAMTAWRVAEERIEAVGRLMAASPHVSHCYRRDPAPDWPYNLYTMIHAADEAQCREIAAELGRLTAVQDYALLFSRRELKKTSMLYFADEESD
jgi:DNA-binding Lrp family transcriptional regulator